MYLKQTESGITYPYSIQDLKEDNKNVSFPVALTDVILEDFGVYRVYDVVFTEDYTKNYVESTPILSGSVYFKNWVITDASEVEITERIEQKWMEVRDTRNRLLAESDWTQFQDSPVTGSKLTEWQVYRQGLRDITLQVDPFNLTWPNRPN